MIANPDFARNTTYDLAFVINYWLSSPSHYDETFAPALDIFKTFDTAGHKAVLSNVPVYEL